MRIYVHSESGSIVEMRDRLVVGIWWLRLDDGGVDDGDSDGTKPEGQKERDPCYPNPLNALNDGMV